MKCIKSIRPRLIKGEFQQEIVRVSDKEAKDKVLSGYWNYTAKHVWKRSGRRYMRGGIVR